MANQLKQRGGALTPKGIPAMNDLRKTKSEMPANKRSSGASAGDMYKKPGKTGRGLVGARSDESSGEVGPLKQSSGPGCDNSKTYGGRKQPIAFSNADGEKPTRFIN